MDVLHMLMRVKEILSGSEQLQCMMKSFDTASTEYKILGEFGRPLENHNSPDKAHKQVATLCLELARANKRGLENSLSEASRVIAKLKVAISKTQIKFDEDASNAVETARTTFIANLNRDIAGFETRIAGIRKQ